MKKKKLYAVRVGHKTGVFTSWPECVAAVKGYRKPIFSAFYSMEEALVYMAGEEIVNKDEKKATDSQES